MTRRRFGLALGVGALGCCLWLALRPSSTSGPASPPVTSAPVSTKAAFTPPRPPSGTASISGRAAPGAQVLAFVPTRVEPRPDTCPCDGECGRESSECICSAAAARALGERQTRSAAAVPVASTTAGPTGEFVLQGLGSEPVEVWAQRDGAIGWQSAVPAGTRDLELSLQAGLRLEGTVRAPEGVALEGGLVQAWSSSFARVFEAALDSSGKVSLGPLPTVVWKLEASAGDASDFAQTDSSSFDLRVNGLTAASGSVTSGNAPVGGAQVRVEYRDCHEVVTADDQGRFVVSGIPAGNALFSASAAAGHAAVAVNLRGGRHPDEIRLELGSSAVLEGIVRSEAGEPIPGAKVSYWLREGRNEIRLIRATETAANGRWSVRTAPGTYTLRAEAEGFGNSETVRREVAPGETHREDFVLQPQALITGRVLDLRGAPLADVTLKAVAERTETFPPPSFEALFNRPSPRSSHTRSLADGSFTLTSLSPGRYQLSAEHARYAKKVQAVEAPSSGLELRLDPGAALLGEVVDERGEPLSRVLVRLTGPTAASAFTDGTGRFHVQGLAAGRYQVEAWLRSQEQQARDEVTLRAGEEGHVRLVARTALSISGKVVSERGVGLKAMVRCQPKAGGQEAHAFSEGDGDFVCYVLSPGPYTVITGFGSESTQVDAMAGDRDLRLVSKSGAVVSGRVVDAQGRPLTAFSVNGRKLEDPEGRFEERIRFSHTMSLQLSAQGLPPVLRTVEVKRGESVDLGVITLGSGRVLRGRVTDATTASPLAGVQVSFGRPSRSVRPVATDASGAFQLGVGDGPVVLWMERTDYATEVRTVPAGQDSVELSLRRGVTLRGRFLDADGKPVRGTVGAQRGDLMLHADSGADGAFVLPALSPGTWLVAAFGPGGAKASRKVEIGDQPEVVVELRP